VIAANTRIIEQGSTDDVFYVVISGNFDITVSQLRVAHRANGECFGELALMYNQPRAATVESTVDSVLWAIDRTTFRRRLAESNARTLEHVEKVLRDAKVDIIMRLSAVDRRKVIAEFEEMNKAAGTVLMTQGEKKPADGTFYMYFLVEGKAHCSILDKDGKSIVFQRDYEPGGYFGELYASRQQAAGSSSTCHGHPFPPLRLCQR
jgi:cAMP-dependent protein kinase regulator